MKAAGLANESNRASGTSSDPRCRYGRLITAPSSSDPQPSPVDERRSRVCGSGTPLPGGTAP